MSPELEEVVEGLLAASTDSRVVSLDEIGDAIGTRAVTTADIEAILAALEARARRIVGKDTGRGVDNLRAVLAATRALASELGRKPTLDEIVARSGLSRDAVHHALALARVMQR